MLKSIELKIRESFIYAFILGLIAEARASYSFNAIFQPRLRPYHNLYEDTLYYRILSYFGSKLDGFSSKLNKKWEESFFKAFFQKMGRVLEESFIGSFILKFRFVYLIALYPAVDYVLRNYVMGGRFGGIWDEGLLVLLVLIIIIRRLVLGIKWKMTDLDFPIMFFFSVLLLLFILKSPDPIVAIDGFRLLFQYILWYFLAVQLIDNVEDIRRLLHLTLVLLFFVGLHACYQYVAKVPMLGNWVDSTEAVTTRSYSIMFSPNLLGSFFTLFLPPAFALFIASKSNLYRIFALMSFLLGSLGLIFTLSRGAWIAAFLALLLFLLLTYKKLLLPIVVAAGTGVVAVPKLADRFFRLFTPDYIEKSSVGGRIFRFQAGMTRLAEDPVFGVGMGRFGGAVAMNYNLSPFYMDNYYMKTLVELGIVGLSSMVLFYIATLILLIRKIRGMADKNLQLIMYGLLAGMMGVLIHNFMENIFESQAMVSLFWAFAAIIMASPLGEETKEVEN